MLYRIDWSHFLIHAIDHFTKSEILNFNYAIVSSILTGGMLSNEVTRNILDRKIYRLNELYPGIEIQSLMTEIPDIFREQYLRFLKRGVSLNGKGDGPLTPSIYKAFINPLATHNDVMIICDDKENLMVDVICEFLEKEYSAPTIDLNQLFSKGYVDPIHINRKKVHDNAVFIRRTAVRKEKESKECTAYGRLELISKMSRKDKIKRLHELGINVTKSDAHDENVLDGLLIDAWVSELQ